MSDLILYSLIVSAMSKPTPPFLLRGFDIQNCIQGFWHNSRNCCQFLPKFTIVWFHECNKQCLLWPWIHERLISLMTCSDNIRWCVKGLKLMFLCSKKRSLLASVICRYDEKGGSLYKQDSHILLKSGNFFYYLWNVAYFRCFMLKKLM